VVCKAIKKAVVLLSGGMDSSTVLAIAIREGYEAYALSFRYGQKAEDELKAAEKIARHLGAKRHLIINIDLGRIGGSALTTDLEVPKTTDTEAIGTEIPITYVPARNTIFLAYALAFAEVIEASNIFIGVNSLDTSGYPDCRPEFIAAFEHMANLGTRAGVEGRRFKIHAPLQHLTKADIIKKGQELGMDFSLTQSCYDPLLDGTACGRCESCLLRQKGFAEAGLIDPIKYAVD